MNIYQGRFREEYQTRCGAQGGMGRAVKKKANQLLRAQVKDKPNSVCRMPAPTVSLYVIY